MRQLLTHFLIPTIFAIAPVVSFAEDPISLDDSDSVNVDLVKQRYWARGEESEMGVVQNRLYSKAFKPSLGFFGGITVTDPFLSVNTLGGSVGFHINEYLGLHLVGWKSQVSPSAALLTFQETIGATTNSNRPLGYVGSELGLSFLYGKLSLLGKAIIYYDMHLTTGIGATLTESGPDWTLVGGIGQKVYVTKRISIKVDYRLMRYEETIVEKVITPKLGQIVGDRVNWSNAITFGIDYLVELFE